MAATTSRQWQRKSASEPVRDRTLAKLRLGRRFAGLDPCSVAGLCREIMAFCGTCLDKCLMLQPRKSVFGQAFQQGVDVGLAALCVDIVALTHGATDIGDRLRLLDQLPDECADAVEAVIDIGFQVEKREAITEFASHGILGGSYAIVLGWVPVHPKT